MCFFDWKLNKKAVVLTPSLLYSFTLNSLLLDFKLLYSLTYET